MNHPPRILDYRTPRPAAARSYCFLEFSALALLIGPTLVILGCAYVFRAMLAYCSGVEPFSGVAFVVSLLVLAGSILVGCSLRRWR